MNHRLLSSSSRTTLIFALACGLSPFIVASSYAQELPPAAIGSSSSSSESAGISEDRLNLATNLISEALTVANQNPSARSMAVRGAAGLIPRLSGTTRQRLMMRWMSLANTLPPETRSQAVSSFFDVAAMHDPNYAFVVAKSVSRPSDRAAGYLALSQRFYHRNWDRSNEYVLLAQSAARRENDPLMRARSLAFVAQQMALVNPVERPAAVREASTAVRRVQSARERDYLMSEVVTAAAKFDLPLARKLTDDIGDVRLRNIASARANLSEISQTTLSETTADRIAKLAQASARYDQRALPILLQLPATPDVFRALSDALPPIYPSATSSMSPMLLERMWKFTEAAEASVFRDQLQSRLARLMVLQDLWRGRAWGQQLAWQGGRVQVGAFLKDVIAYRHSALRVEPLQQVAQSNVQRAIKEARTLPPIPRVEALLLIAGEVLG
ncbi:MAG TPA: hypothetical protein VGB77_06095 [Abditibacteriaceae bacterium]